MKGQRGKPMTVLPIGSCRETDCVLIGVTSWDNIGSSLNGTSRMGSGVTIKQQPEFSALLEQKGRKKRI